MRTPDNLDPDMRRGVHEMDTAYVRRRRHRDDVYADRTRSRKQTMKMAKRTAQTVAATGLAAAAVYAGGRPGPSHAKAERPVTGGQPSVERVQKSVADQTVDNAANTAWTVERQAAEATTSTAPDQPMAEGQEYTPDPQTGGLEAGPESHSGGVSAE